MTKEQRKKCNIMARLFYKSMGYEVDGDYDFSNSTHPQEIGVWNQALIAHDVVGGTSLYDKHYIDPRKRLRERFK